MQTVKFTVAGLHCDGCVKSVRGILERQKGVVSANVDLKNETADVQANADFDAATTMSAVAQAGFVLKPA